MYSMVDVVTTGFALFAMLFGAGNLIFPPMLGYELGTNWQMAAFGFILTGVGLPLLAIIASGNAGGRIEDFTNKVSPLFAKIYGVLVILAIGPLLAIPRTGAASYELTFFHLGEASPTIKYIYLFVYFLLAFMFSIKESKVIDRIGKILTPILLTVLAAILIKGTLFSDFTVTERVFDLPFKKGFTEGYQTLDAMAGVVYASVILRAIRQGKNLTKEQEKLFFLKSSFLAIIGLAIVYVGLTYIGATFGNTELIAGAEKTDLLVKISSVLLGRVGNLILAVCVAGACLSTAIGLIVTVGEFFSGLLKVSYEKVVIVTTIVSFIFSMFGVNEIVKVSVPVLILMYPVTIVLIFLNFFKLKNHYVYKGTATVALVIGFYEALGVMGIKAPEFMAKIYNTLPFGNLGLTWFVPVLVVGVLCSFIKTKEN